MKEPEIEINKRPESLDEVMATLHELHRLDYKPMPYKDLNDVLDAHNQDPESVYTRVAWAGITAHFIHKMDNPFKQPWSPRNKRTE